MKRNYILFEWLSEKRDEFIFPISNELLLMRTNQYDVSIHRWDAPYSDFGNLAWKREEIIRLRDRESREEQSIVSPDHCRENWIERLIKSKNRNRDLWILQLSISAAEYA